MGRRVSVLAAMLVVGPLLFAQERAPTRPPAQADGTVTSPPASGTLPVRRVVLYKTGVGYFEHLGNIRNQQNVAIRFTSAQLNDVLKSLTTIDMGNGQVTGVSYNSIAPIEQRLGALRLPLGQTSNRIELFAALRGARLEVTSTSGVITGRLLNVERTIRTRGEDVIPTDNLSLVTDGGDVRSFELTPAVHVRILDRELRQDVSRYLDVVGSSREQDVRQMVISTAGTGERPLFVSYVSEVPIWKTTYRLVLRDQGAKPLLQGWAIVDNTIGEDWKGVELSLVAGAPQSFIQNISQPYYGRRPTVPLPQAAMLTPQTHQATLKLAEAAESFGGLSSDEAPKEIVPESPHRSAADGVIRGIPSGRVGGVVGGLPAAPPPPAAIPTRAYEQAAGQQARATAAALGDLFEYRIKEPVTLQKNQSALVPIVSAEIAAEKVALWNRLGGSGRPLRAVWLTNNSGLTLDGGTISVIDANAFAGEGLIEPLKPGERRLLSYAADQGVLLDSRMQAAPARVVSIRARDGIVIQQTEDRESWIYTARSEERIPITLIIEHQQRQGWTLASGQSPAESTPDAQRFRLVVPAGKEAVLVVREVNTGQTRVALADFMGDHVSQLAIASGASAEPLQRALAPLVAKRSELAGIEHQLATLNSQLQGIVADQQRLRENMKALRGSAEEKSLLQRYTRQLDDQEDKLDALRLEMANTAVLRETARQEFNRLIAAFEYEG